MKRYNLNLSVVMGMFMFILVMYTIITTGKHEEVHAAIGKYYGCVNGSIHYHLLYAYYTCHEYAERSEEARNTEYMLHGMNEIVSYNQDTFVGVVVMCSFIITISMLFLRGEKDG